MNTAMKSAVAALGALALVTVFFAYQTPAMALVLSAIRYCF